MASSCPHLFTGKGTNINWSPNMLNTRINPFSIVPSINKTLSPTANKKLYFFSNPNSVFLIIKSNKIVWHRKNVVIQKKYKQELKSPITTVKMLITTFYPSHFYSYIFFYRIGIVLWTLYCNLLFLSLTDMSGTFSMSIDIYLLHLFHDYRGCSEREWHPKAI